MAGPIMGRKLRNGGEAGDRGSLVGFIISPVVSCHGCQTEDGGIVSGSPTVQRRTFNRPDPLTHFKRYHGGFDVRNKHYLASAAFTGVHGYTFAGVWLLCGLAFAIFIAANKFFRGGLSSPPPSLHHYYLHVFLLLLFFTSLAIVASSLALVVSEKTLRRTEKLKESVVGIGKDALESIGRVMKTTKQMQFLLIPYNQEICDRLNSTTQDLRSNSRVIRRFIDTTGQSFHKATHTSYLAHLIIVAVNLATLVGALVLPLLHWRPGFIIFADDACSSFEDFEQNPQNSSLGAMLPCVNASFSGKLITEIGYTIHSFIVELNSNMSVVYRLLGVVGEQSEEIMGGRIKICDPFSAAPNYTYIPQSCSQGAIPIGQIPKILAKFTCHKEDTSKEECRKEGRFITESSYNMAHAYSRSIQDLLDIYPDMQRLSNCTLVKNGVTEIVDHQCRPIRTSTTLLWSCMISLSIIMVILVLAWVAEAFLCWDKHKPLSIYSHI
ncbi:hypothetical protein PIB30_013455 [Stylosanthes scabra]|uniref:Uncharacterized protein n=1 Tax=Stylosanthes scabra TaxID=79078 RepID=A0ABU6Y4M0_9FABA|nr:hypothetical protein [Stylosanthes scabra]